MEGRITRRKATLALGLVLATGALLMWLAINPKVQAQAECPSPQLIDTITGRGAQQSPPFNTTTNLFRISYQTQVDTPNATFIVGARKVDDPRISSEVATINTQGAQNGETFANAPPGRYFLDINTTGAVSYTITIEACGEGQANPGEGTSSGTPGGSTKSGGGSTTSPRPSPSPPAPKTPATPPAPSPVSPKPAPPFNAGGPKGGPAPIMPTGSCPKEFPTMRNGACYLQ